MQGNFSFYKHEFNPQLRKSDYAFIIIEEDMNQTNGNKAKQEQPKKLFWDCNLIL